VTGASRFLTGGHSATIVMSVGVFGPGKLTELVRMVRPWRAGLYFRPELFPEAPAGPPC